MADSHITVRALLPHDLAAYKALRDATLAGEPTAFTSDAETERKKTAESYASRLGAGPGVSEREADPSRGGSFTLGAFRGNVLLGAVSSERENRMKGSHAAHVVGMMVRADARGLGIGRLLIEGCIAQARLADGLEMLTLSVTATNAGAVHLYSSVGFVRYGSLDRAIKVDGSYHTKDLMVLTL